MSMTTESKSAFISRFDRIWAQARRVQLSQSLCWSVLTALAGIGLLAAADYWLELPHLARTSAVVMIAACSFVVGISLAFQSVNRWRRQATAAAIEQVFPQLGQRIRTTVQYGPLSSSELEHAGVATTMVTALEDDTIRRAQPLPLDAVIPWKALAMTSMLAAVLGLALAGASATDWQWRAAATRAFLGDEPYTTITVKPGNLAVRDGESATIEIEVEGRTGRAVTFSSHVLGTTASEWEPQTLEPVEPAATTNRADNRIAKFIVPLSRIREPLEYRVTAGSAASDTYQVEVLYPLKIVKIQTAVQPPEYTGLPEATVDNGNVVGLIGSQARVMIELDQAPETAWLETQELNRPEKDAPAPEKVPLQIDGVKLTASLPLTTDKTYSVFAKAKNGMELTENLYRIRVRNDEAPQVWFESPSEALEVHTLAEVLMRIRVSDDFGLSRSGIIFEVNNEEEFPLLAEDFQAAAAELQQTGKLSPKTRATLEKVLPLEHFQLTQQDSVMYYAFAEDNRPDNPQRTESDLRFIDLRPFKRTYRVVDAEGMMMSDGGPQLKSLDELVARQRYALNRTIQIGRRFKDNAQPDLSGVDALIKFEAELAKSTRELAEGLERLGLPDTELLYQAETAMLGATDSLSAGKYDTATLQQRDALKYLIEGRQRIEITIRKNPNRQQLAQLRNFDRQQQQKLRRPKTDEEEKREVAQRLDQLAQREEFIYKTLGGESTDGTQPSDTEALGAGAQTTKPKSDSENKESATGESPAKQPSADQNSPMPADDATAGNTSAEKAAQDQKLEDQKPGDQGSTPPSPAADKSPGTGGEQPGQKPDEQPGGDQPAEKGTPAPGQKPGTAPGTEPGANPADAKSPDAKSPDAKSPGAGPGEKPADPQQAGKGAGQKAEKTPSGQGGAESDQPENDGQSGTGRPTDRELEDQQLDIAVESREIEKLLGKLKGVTDLSKERIAAAAKMAEETAKSLSQRDPGAARKSAELTSEQFRELSQQVKALLAEEQAERIAAAQQLAANLAREQDEFVDRLAKSSTNGGKGNPDPKNKNPMGQAGGKAAANPPQPGTQPGGAGDKAEQIARQAQTLQDVLNAAAKATDPQDEAAAKKVADVIGSLKLDELMKRLENLPNQVGSGQTQEAKATSEDAKERLEAAAEQLGSLQRSIVAPKVEELAKLEAKMAALDEKLDELEAPPDIAKWHVKTNELLEELEKAGISEELRQQFVEEMKRGGWNSATNRGSWNWARREGGYYAAPQTYRPLISKLQADIRNRIQELMLGDLAYSGDEPIPPQYEEMVDRYQQVLATEGKARPKRATPATKLP